MKGIFIGGLILALASVRNVGVLGASAGIYTYQSFQTERIIHVGNLLTRMELISVIATVSMGFIKIAVLLYGTVLGGAQVLGLRSFRPLIIPTAILMAICAEQNFKSVADNLFFAQQIYPIYAFPIQVGIPFLTFIVAWIRGLPIKDDF